MWERIGSVEECLTRDRGAAGSVPHRCHCVVSFSMTHLPLFSTGLTHEDQSWHNWRSADWEAKNQIKKNNIVLPFNEKCDNYKDMCNLNFSLPASVVSQWTVQTFFYPDQAWHNFLSDLDPNWLTLWWYSRKYFLWQQNHEQICSIQRLKELSFTNMQERAIIL